MGEINLPMATPSAHYQVDPQAEYSLRKLLERLEQELDPAEHQAIRDHYIRTLHWEPVERPPLRLLFQERLQSLDEKSSTMYPICEAVLDPAKMLVNELWYGRASSMGWLEVRDDQPLQVRANLGIGLMASTFGARIDVVENNPPWVEPLSVDLEQIPRLVEAALDQYDLETVTERGWIPRAVAFYEYFQRIFAGYPNVEKSVAIVMPDLQGPFDTAAMLWGSDIFLALYAHAELVDRLLETIARAQVKVHDYLRQWIGREILPTGFCHQHGLMIRGNILIRCDSNLMVSPEMYRERILPWDEYVVREVGGGSFHSCGKWDHNVASVIESGAFGTVDFGMNQSQYNDIPKHYALARRHKIHFNQINTTEADIVSGEVLKQYPTGVTLVYSTPGIESAQRLIQAYRKHTVSGVKTS